VPKRGNLIHEPKLTWQQVNAIRRDYRWHSSTAGGSALAKRYRVSANTINKIVRGKIWRVTNGDGNVAPPLMRPMPNWKACAIAEIKCAGHLQKLASLLEGIQNHPDDELVENWLLSVIEPTVEEIKSEEIDARHTGNTLFYNNNLYERAILET